MTASTSSKGYAASMQSSMYALAADKFHRHQAAPVRLRCLAQVHARFSCARWHVHLCKRACNHHIRLQRQSIALTPLCVDLTWHRIRSTLEDMCRRNHQALPGAAFSRHMPGFTLKNVTRFFSRLSFEAVAVKASSSCSSCYVLFAC